MCDNKTFWQSIKPLMSNKIQTSSKITLIENGEIIKDDHSIANIMNNHFTNVIKGLSLKEDNASHLKSCEEILSHYENHESIKAIKNNFKESCNFKFEAITADELRKEIMNISSNKASVSNDIPISILKNSCDVFVNKLTDIFNSCIKENWNDRKLEKRTRLR